MIKLELSEQMVAVVGEALGNMPYKISAPVVAEIQKQIEAQRPKANGKGELAETLDGGLS
jgi:16S rRNA A1518/A1519 N6-dimethyltransferase RsmA/KsgA/DIM1 with predicted DNA glycosylase/AP lyase activity